MAKLNRRQMLQASLAVLAGAALPSSLPVSEPSPITVPSIVEPKRVGKTFALEETIMYVPKESFLIEFFAYESPGGTFNFTDTPLSELLQADI